jgi:hypothetical protein
MVEWRRPESHACRTARPAVWSEGLGPGKEAIMQANTGADRHVFGGFHVDWKQLRSWKGKTMTKEKLAEIFLLASTVTVLGYVVWFVAKAADNYTILGLG